MKINKREIGTGFENVAVEFLKENNYQIIATNYRSRHGEIDIIAKDMSDEYIVFVEVKYRSSDKFGMPVEAVDSRKQHRIIYSSQCFISENNLPVYGLYRYDVISIYKGEIRHIKNTF